MNMRTFYKNYHNYFIENRNNFSNDIQNLDGKSQYYSKYSKQNFSFYYIKNFQQISNIAEIIKCRDILNGIYLGNYPIGTKFTIYKERGINDILLEIEITEKNRHDIFLPIRNKDFLNIFLLSSQRFFIKSNVILTEPIYLIYSNIKRSFHNYFFNSKHFIQKLEKSNYLVYTEYFCSITEFNDTNFEEEYSIYFFYCDIDKHYGRKILKFYRNYRLRLEIKNILENEFNICKDVSNIIINYI